MASSILLPQFFIPVESVKLGRLVVSIEEPHQNCHDPSYIVAPEAIITMRDKYDASRQAAVSTDFASVLTSMLSSGFSKRAKTNTKIATDRVKTYILGNPGRWFNGVMRIEETRRWAQKVFNQGDNMFIIVGFHTVSNARVFQLPELGREATGGVKIPIGLALNAVGAIAPFANIIDPSVTGSRQAVEGEQVQFVAPGEQVCAVQYRQVSHRFLLSHEIDRAFLATKPNWVPYDRYPVGDKGEVEVIQVEMMELQERDEKWDREVTSDGEILLLRSD
jgi:hypothetical protein